MIEGLLTLAGMLFLGAVYGYVIVQPVASAPRVGQSNGRFVLSDLFALTVILCLPFTFYSVVRKRYVADAGFRDILAFLLCVIVVYLWWSGSRVLSRIGILESRKRVVYLVFIVPLVVIGSLVAIPMWLVMTLNLEDMDSNWRSGWFGLTIGLPVVGLGCRRVIRWVMSSGKQAPAGATTSSLSETPQRKKDY